MLTLRSLANLAHRHLAEVALPDEPFAVLFGQDRPDQPDHGHPVREDPDLVAAALDRRASTALYSRGDCKR